MKHLRSLFDLTPDDLRTILRTGRHLRERLRHGERPRVLDGFVAGLLFEKPSLRTRVSFQCGMSQLGGDSLFLGEDVGWGHREPINDFTRVLGQFVDVVVCRAKSHGRVTELASFDAAPVINGLTDLCHPCQAIADVMTIEQSLGDYAGRHLVFVGDGNNVSQSLALACAMLGMRFTLARPDGYALSTDWIRDLRDRYPDADITETDDPRAAVSDADAVYGDVWTSMGQEEESRQRRRDFADYQINGELMSVAPSHTRFLHCLPAVRGEEVTTEVIDGPRSDIIPQAGNRMHGQKGLLVWLLRPDWIEANVD